MKSKLWGVVVFLLITAVAAAPASSSEAYVAASTMNGDATYMALDPDDILSDQQNLQLSSDNYISGYSFGNGIGDFNNDGQLDYILALGRYSGDIYIFPKAGPGNQFDMPVWAGTWAHGVYPADIAVADFNGDGNLDFVLNYFYSYHCGLYLGDGNFGFTFTLLEDTTSFPAMDIDAADFNNDEIADFVVAPNSTGPFFVHLGNPDGTFTKVIVDRAPSLSRAYGVAAADFVEDPDGIVDLAVSSPRALEIYTGNGDGTFVLKYTWDFPMNSSALDNGDFDRDGHQDLVVADYDADHAGVALLLGDGQGQFEHYKTYLGENTGYRKAVTGLPYLPNKAPVAQLAPEIIEITVGETVEWDASESYDEDGAIVRYEWDYGDGAVAPMAVNTMAVADAADHSGEPQSSYTYFDSGTYFVTLKVTDDQGATSTVQAEVRANPIDVSVTFSPRKLNKKSKGKWITATIWVPGDYNAGMIDPDSVILDLPDAKGALPAYVSNRDRRYYKYFKSRFHRKRKLKVKFDRQALVKQLGDATGEIKLTVSGEIASMEFAGSGTITAFGKQKKISFKNYLKQLIMSCFSKGKSKH